MNTDVRGVINIYCVGRIHRPLCISQRDFPKGYTVHFANDVVRPIYVNVHQATSQMFIARDGEMFIK